MAHTLIFSRYEAETIFTELFKIINDGDNLNSAIYSDSVAFILDTHVSNIPAYLIAHLDLDSASQFQARSAST
jgi:hypothetical protein